MMPQTVPNKPTYGLVEPTVASIARFCSNRSSSRSCATRIARRAPSNSCSAGIPCWRSRLNSPNPDSKMLCKPVPERPLVSMVRYKVARSPPDQNAVSNFSAWRRERPITALLRRMTAQEATDAISSSATTTCTMGLASSTMLQTDKSLGIAPLREKILGDGTRLQRAGIEAGNPHGGIDQLLAAPHNRLAKMYCGTCQAFKCSRDKNFIMQHRGPQEIDGNIYHDKLQLAFRAQLLLIHPQRPQPVGPAALQEF